MKTVLNIQIQHHITIFISSHNHSTISPVSNINNIRINLYSYDPQVQLGNNIKNINAKPYGTMQQINGPTYEPPSPMVIGDNHPPSHLITSSPHHITSHLITFSSHHLNHWPSVHTPSHPQWTDCSLYMRLDTILIRYEDSLYETNQDSQSNSAINNNSITHKTIKANT